MQSPTLVSRFRVIPVYLTWIPALAFLITSLSMAGKGYIRDVIGWGSLAVFLAQPLWCELYQGVLQDEFERAHGEFARALHRLFAKFAVAAVTLYVLFAVTVIFWWIFGGFVAVALIMLSAAWCACSTLLALWPLFGSAPPTWLRKQLQPAYSQATLQGESHH